MTSERLRPVGPGRVRTALAGAAELGMFFGLADPARQSGGWQPVRVLYAGGFGDLDVILEATRASLHGCEPRVAASLFFQGYASRLLSPQLACLATDGCIPEMSATRLCWRRPDGQAIELGLTAGAGYTGSGRELIEQLVRVSFGEHLQPLADALRLRVRIASGLLTGNAAAALISGLGLLSRQLGPDWRSLAAVALAQPQLRGAGTWRVETATAPGRPGGAAFVRRSCCLYYRVKGGGLCGDCPLRRRELRRRELRRPELRWRDGGGPRLCYRQR